MSNERPSHTVESGDAPIAARAGRRRRGDAGLTLVELVASFAITGMLLTVMSNVLLLALDTSPTTEARIDDARSTRMLSTYLAQDTMSVPPYLPEQSMGGFDIDPTANGNNNDCGAAGSNIVHMQWEETITSTITYVANYRFVVDGDTAQVHRVLCQSTDGGASFTTFADRAISPDVASATVPVATVTLDATTGDVEVLSFELEGVSGETVLIETTPRNPGEFFS